MSFARAGRRPQHCTVQSIARPYIPSQTQKQGDTRSTAFPSHNTPHAQIHATNTRLHPSQHAPAAERATYTVPQPPTKQASCALTRFSPRYSTSPTHGRRLERQRLTAALAFPASMHKARACSPSIQTRTCCTVQYTTTTTFHSPHDAAVMKRKMRTVL